MTKSKTKSRRTSKSSKYSKMCDSSQSRHPRELTKSEYVKIKNMIPSHIEISGKYYICPDIFDMVVKRPVTIKEFINNDYKSPYGANNKLYFTGVARSVVKEYEKNKDKKTGAKIVSLIGKRNKIQMLKTRKSQTKKNSKKTCCY